MALQDTGSPAELSARAEWLFAGLIDRFLNHWGHALPLDGGNGDDDNVDSETDAAIPEDDNDHDIASLASQPSSSLQPSSFQSRPLALVGQFACSFLMIPGDLELDALFEDHAVSCAIIEDMLALERAFYWRCTPGQLLLSDRQSANC